MISRFLAHRRTSYIITLVHVFNYVSLTSIVSFYMKVMSYPPILFMVLSCSKIIVPIHA